MEVANLLQASEPPSSDSSKTASDYPLSDQQENMLDFLQRSFLSAHGNYLAVIQIENARYLLGVQLAKLLRRETSNLYRSLKRSGISLQRASSDQVRWINSLNLCFVQKTHSITFVPLREAIDFLTEEFRRRKPPKPEQPYSGCSTLPRNSQESGLLYEQSPPSQMVFSFSAQPSTSSGSVSSQATPLDFKQYSLGMLEEAQSYFNRSYPTSDYGHLWSSPPQPPPSSTQLPYLKTLSYSSFNVYDPQRTAAPQASALPHSSLCLSGSGSTAGRAPALTSSFSCAISECSPKHQQASQRNPTPAFVDSKNVYTTFSESVPTKKH